MTFTPPDDAKRSYGALAEFHDAESLLNAVRAARDEGYEQMEAYTPYPVHAISKALGYRSRLPYVIFIGGLAGAVTGMVMQWWMSAVDYPINVGGRPLFSWPSFIIVTFELTILFAAFAAVLGMLAANKLPQPHHPVFDVPAFELASRNRFFLLLHSKGDPRFDYERARDFLDRLSPLTVWEVPG